MTKLIVNVTTGEETVLELDEADIAQQEIDEAKGANEAAEAVAKAAAKQAVLDKLGLSSEEVATLLN